MDSRRWEEVQRLFHQMADLPGDEQQPALEAACGGDADLREQVAALLQADAAGDSLLDRDVAHVAHAMIGHSSELPTHAFGPYHISEVLGEGGMGVVYLGERADLGSVAAIKLLRDAWISPARRERFASEQRTLAQLNHPAIARLLDADTLPDGTPWFVMEYVKGLSLTEYCRTHNASIAERFRLFREVCEAVQHAHRHAIIHRDLKPSNIMVTEEGRIKLLDFGIAKQIEGVESPVDHTRSGLRLMTPAYAAPEQLRGEGLGVHTDVYALGVVLYELLLGTLPFDLARKTPSEADTLILTVDADKPSTVARKLAPLPPHLRDVPVYAWTDLDVICLTAMQKDPARRYSTVDALMRDIDHFLASEPLEARADSLGYRLSKFVRRNTRAVVATALVAITVIGLVAFDGVRLTRARIAAEHEAARTSRVEAFMLNLFQGGDASAGPADSLRVTTLLARGVQEARSLSTDPAVQADLYLTLGGIYQKLGQFDRADSLVQLGLATRRTVFGPDHPDVGQALVALGLIQIDQAEYQAAEVTIRQGMAIEARSLPPDHPALALANLALGRALEERGEYATAILLLREAVRLERLRASGHPTPELAEAIEELANTHFMTGAYDLSDSLNREILGMNRTLHGDHHPSVADVLINLGAIQFQRGNYREAERFDREALAIDLRWYGPDHYETASAMTLVGRALNYQGHYGEAVGILRQSLAIQERVNGPVHPRVASALNDLGVAALQAGQLDSAAADFQRMESIYHQVYDDSHYLIALARANLASVYLEQQQYATAEAMFRDVIARYTAAQGAQHMNTAVAHIKLGRTLLREGRAREAEVETRTGYETLKSQTAPSVSWLQSARKDLAALYDSLREPEKAARIREEMADTGLKAVKPGRGN